MKHLFNDIFLYKKKLLAFIEYYGLEFKCLIFIIFAIFIKTLKTHDPKQNKIWIIGENYGKCLKDNGYCFFKYCHKNHHEIEAFFIADKNSIKKDPFLSSNKKVLLYGSLQHILILFNADTFIYSQTHRDIIFYIFFVLLSKGKRIVSLKHGIIGLKKCDAFFDKYCNEADIISTASEFEKTIIDKNTCANEYRLKITGLARYDYLEDTSSYTNLKQIVYLPTWRDWLKNRSLLKSNFYNNISSFLSDEYFLDLLKMNNIFLKFHLHKNMNDYFHYFNRKCENIIFVNFGQESVQNMIKESMLLITDYSSVCWDFYYMNKPVIFYQFDKEDYLKNRGTYLNLEKDLFGDCAYSKNTLLDHLEFYIKTNFKQKEIHQIEKARFFKYSDRFNCKRIYQEIIKLS